MSNTAHSTKAKSTHSSTTSQMATKKKNTENLGEAAKKLEAADALAATTVENAKRMRDEANAAMESALRAKSAADQAAASIKTGTVRVSRNTRGVKTTIPAGVQAPVRKRQSDAAAPRRRNETTPRSTTRRAPVRRKRSPMSSRLAKVSRPVTFTYPPGPILTP